MSRKSDRFSHEPTCRPLDSYEDIAEFLRNPPSWRSLCKELTPHSRKKIRNMTLNSLVGAMGPDRPPTFCHFSPDAEDVERYSADSLPKTLVCHDMANGYHDDSKIDGTSNHTAYSFYHWAGIDIFCYFSHHLITIPPLSWINVGHAHGVKVIGTVITEWSEGYDFWEFVLSSEFQYKDFACALVSIAKLLGFDGWLLNVENKVSQPEVLVEFVRYLHRKLHEELPYAELIWYDAVTVKGTLNWQNSLNDYNKDFFDACDGLFTNYSWKESDVAASAEAAGDRVTDVYVGIDVWGRNFYGGGQFNTAEAMELASSYGCSLAIFAPAWTHEAGERRDADVALAEHLAPGQLLRLRDRALWGSLWPYLATRLPSRLPFQTSFCRGAGLKRRLYGEVLCPGPWYNLRHMQYQPNATYGPHGYLLSTPERIQNLSRTMVTRDKKGIIKYDSAFEHTRHELHTVRSTRELQEERMHRDSLTVVEMEEQRHKEEDKKYSMRNVFKHMFRLKSRRSSDDLSKKDKHSPEHDKAHDRHDSSNEHTDELTDENREGASTDAHHKPHVQIRENELDETKDESHDESEDKSSPELTAESRDAAHSTHSWDVKSGWSMRQLSIHIKLGSGHKTRLALACVPGEYPCLEPYYDDSYIGGSCLCVHPSDQLSPSHRWTRLFHCEFPCTGDLILCVVTKTLPECEEQYLNVKLFARDVADDEVRVSCVGRVVAGSPRSPSPAPGLSPARPLTLYPLSRGPPFKELQKYLLLNQPAFYMSPENSYGWTVRYYIAPMEGTVLTSVNLHCGLSSGPILLGHIGLCLRTEDADGEWPETQRSVVQTSVTDNPDSFASKPVIKNANYVYDSGFILESDSPDSSRVARDVQTPDTAAVRQNMRPWAPDDTLDYVKPQPLTEENAPSETDLPSKGSETHVPDLKDAETNTENISQYSKEELQSNESVSEVSPKPSKLHLKLSDSGSALVLQNPSPNPTRSTEHKDPKNHEI